VADLLITPVRGDACPSIWQAVNVGPVVTLNVHDDNLDISVLLFDTTNTGCFGATSRLAGKLDASATINATFDLAQPPYLAPLFILPGLSGILAKSVGPGATRIIQVPQIVEKLHFQSGVDSEVKYSFDAKMNCRVGTLIYPSL
jgi:hypothetical protein